MKHKKLEVIQLAVLNDNYIYLIHDPISMETAVIDPAIAQPVLDTLDDKGWSLNYIFNTHHHWDHIGANLELKEKTNCQIFASKQDRSRIPSIDHELSEADVIQLGHQPIHIIETFGHTLGHIVYYLPQSELLFCGDTLFSMGCGRLFEGSAEQMWHSLQKLKKLPKQTQIYCAHEYTQENARFAVTLEPKNQRLQQRIEQVKQLRAEGKSTLPSTIGQELATNPFFREQSIALQHSIAMSNRSAVEIFIKIRSLKDNF